MTFRNPLQSLFERRSAIASSYELARYLLGGQKTVAGQVVTETTSLNLAAVWTGVNLRSLLLATLPVDVVERVSERERQPRPNHSVARVLSQPNSWQTGPEWLGMMEAHRLLRGNCYSWKNRARDLMAPVDRETGEHPLRTIELIPLHPDQVEVLDVVDELRGPAVYRLHRRNGTTVDFTADEIFHHRGISTDGRMGRSFISDMREAIGGALATQEHANSLWSHDATPSIALTHPKTLSEKAKKNLEDSWEATYGRGKDKKRVAVIEEGMTIEQLSLTPEDGQFLQTQQDLRAQIAAALMVPPHLMGLAEKATSWGTGIEQQNIALVTLTLRPALALWEARLARDLIAVPGKFQVKFNVNGMLRGDAVSQGQLLWQLRQMGAVSANDVRSIYDWNPIPNGDTYLQPTNLAPLGFVPATGSGGNV